MSKVTLSHADFQTENALPVSKVWFKKQNNTRLHRTHQSGW